MRPGTRAALVGLVACGLLGCGLVGCGLGTEIEDVPCPPGGTDLAYDGFGKAFFATHCVTCHGGNDGYSSRSYTTVESIREDRERIFINAAADNTYMPPGPDGPDEKQRNSLAEWLACGAP